MAVQITQIEDDPLRTFPIVNTEDGLQTYAYGELWPIQNDVSIHLNCFALGRKKVPGSLGKLRHLVEAYSLIWPHRAAALNDWTIERFAECCRGTKEIVLAGGSSTGKSTDMAFFALLWWWANPTERAVLICSTTIMALKRRIWAYIADGISEAVCEMPGKVTTSPVPKVTYPRVEENGKKKTDERHLIIGAALKEGDTKKALADLIGYHPIDGLLVIIDEATDVTPAVLQAITNWDNGNEGKFQLIALGNSSKRTDVHGLLAEPEEGWNAVHPDTHIRWKTKRRGVCLFFDCYRSPAIHAKNKDILSVFLMNQKKINREEERLGKDSPQFMRFVRGFWPSEEGTNTVLSESEVAKGNARSRIVWAGTGLVPVGACDPAYSNGGDRCILRFGQFGESVKGRMVLEYGDIVVIPLDTRSKEPLSYQIVEYCRRECDSRGVEAEHFALDTNGWGAGAGDILQKEWSPMVHRIINHGKSTERSVDAEMSMEDGAMARKASEVFVDMITEMAFAMRAFVLSDQIRGLDEETIKQMVTRVWIWKSRRMTLEPKKDYKKRMGQEDQPTGSPDEFDSGAMLLEVARRAGFELESNVPDYVKDNERDRWQEQWELSMGHVAALEEEKGFDWQDSIGQSSSFGDSWED